LAANVTARFSKTGYTSLLTKSVGDDGTMEKLGLRLDMPLELLRELLSRATDTVRARLLAAAPPEKQQQIQSALAGIASQLIQESSAPRDFTAAESLVESLNRSGKLNEAVFAEFVRQRKSDEVIAALALFSGCNCRLIEQGLKNVSHEAVSVIGKAAKLSLPTVRLILERRFAPHKPSDAEIEAAKDAFLQLSQQVAQRTLRFMQVQETAKKTA
jgi:hypothetical protein